MKPGSHLPYEMPRTISRGMQIGCTLFFAVLLAAVPVVILAQHEKFIAHYIFAAVFAIAAISVLVSVGKQFVALRTPLTVVETDREVFKRGEDVRLYFRQAGPGQFESLKASLKGKDTWRKRRARRETDLGTFNLFDSGPFEATADHPFERTVTVRIPDVPNPKTTERHTVEWWLIVIAKPQGGSAIEHQFAVTMGSK